MMKKCIQCRDYVSRPIYHKHEDKWLSLCWECYIYHIVGDRIELMPYTIERLTDQIAYSSWGINRALKSYLDALRSLNRTLEENAAFWRD
jgi:hypothetical protein